MTIAPSSRPSAISASRRSGRSRLRKPRQRRRHRLRRLEQLLKDGAASGRSVEETRAQHQVSAAALTAARERWPKSVANPVGAQGELTVSAPFDGIVQRVAAVPGQTVAASAPSSSRAGRHAVGARAVYAGDDTIDEAHRRGAPARELRSSHSGDARRRAAPRQRRRRVGRSPLRALRRGETLPSRRTRARRAPARRGPETGLVVPEAAVLYDIQGATWVYEDLGGNAYAAAAPDRPARRRPRRRQTRSRRGAEESSPPARRSCLAPSSGQGTDDALAGRPLAPQPHRRRRTGVLSSSPRRERCRTAPLDVFPEFAPPLVEMQTEAPGLSTDEVETLVTVPLEAALNGVPGLRRSARSRCWACRRWCCLEGTDM